MIKQNLLFLFRNLFFQFRNRIFLFFQSPKDRILSESRRERLYSDSRRDRIMSDGSESRSECRVSKRRHRRLSTESDTPEKDMISFADLIKGKAKPSNLASELLRHTDYDDSVLGQVKGDQFITKRCLRGATALVVTTVFIKMLAITMLFIKT